ncbi:MAG: asparagine synthase (glutamine-hydrolyzing) [Candidatus Zambryskibacteria bacterium RIFCSPLOWO2_02_FULL_39_26]|uniref:asparagine synthase (glutamine-hydrolyzing) n=1 Tax=Candidatus Zambryskibacteria bacterium RIFCSPLOWO2_12_FULL_39_23 TaxID=1802776 RepID=A0A1G2UQX2_9BACT|nr:MAG: asparagine synthase (glutamine-hydrolyzing) [Candidatus Zambryskibacteria bacterium RIFCSPLOWO2_02_FULL_39_26]OHB11740.1 MAG: asparagine synthase (glutamine-hydrolyzing) [Candidatus Zambryskibacteria bacterium RIFCSPLOWO2_12_FULL_39_23]
MCGIAGVIGQNIQNKEKVIGKMVAKIAHRGPDDDGFFVDSNVGLGMRRLSIIDLKTGRQPVTSENGKILIFFNGEIYNYKELREELLIKNYIFKTASDTEVILHLYEEYGEEMLPKLRGMFAFCIYNINAKKIFIARDYFGIKPMYYLTQNDRIIGFSSEIKSFLSFPGFKVSVNDKAVINYLSFQYNPLTETFFKGVYKLPPGHFLSIDLKRNDVQIKKYWSMEFNPDNNLDEKDTTQKIYETMQDSVEHHMIADVPVGAFLSGGIDSSIIATLMQKIKGDRRIKTFTVGFNTLTEGREASETASFLGTDHTELTIGPDEYFSALKKAVYHFDEPVADPSALGLYFLAEEARKYVKVVLSGEGADELFGGYNIYLEPFARRKLSWLPQNILKFFLNLPFQFYGKNYLNRVNSKMADWYIGNASIFKQDELSFLWKGRKEKSLSLDFLYKQVGGLSDSAKMQYIDINIWLTGDILAKADKMTMAHSLELRVPFLDIEVAKLAKILPDRFKWRGGVTKYLLRQAFKSVVPETTRNRKKLGFPVPIKDWFTKDREGLYRTIINNRYIKKHMDVGYIQNLIDEHTMKKTDNSRKIYTLLMLALWYDVFIKMENVNIKNQN